MGFSNEGAAGKLNKEVLGRDGNDASTSIARPGTGSGHKQLGGKEGLALASGDKQANRVALKAAVSNEVKAASNNAAKPAGPADNKPGIVHMQKPRQGPAAGTAPSVIKPSGAIFSKVQALRKTAAPKAAVAAASKGDIKGKSAPAAPATARPNSANTRSTTSSSSSGTSSDDSSDSSSSSSSDSSSDSDGDTPCSSNGGSAKLSKDQPVRKDSASHPEQKQSDDVPADRRCRPSSRSNSHSRGQQDSRGRHSSSRSHSREHQHRRCTRSRSSSRCRDRQHSRGRHSISRSRSRQRQVRRRSVSRSRHRSRGHSRSSSRSKSEGRSCSRSSSHDRHRSRTRSRDCARNGAGNRYTRPAFAARCPPRHLRYPPRDGQHFPDSRRRSSGGSGGHHRPRDRSVSRRRCDYKSSGYRQFNSFRASYHHRRTSRSPSTHRRRSHSRDRDRSRDHNGSRGRSPGRQRRHSSRSSSRDGSRRRHHSRSPGRPQQQQQRAGGSRQQGRSRSSSRSPVRPYVPALLSSLDDNQHKHDIKVQSSSKHAGRQPDSSREELVGGHNRPEQGLQHHTSGDAIKQQNGVEDRVGVQQAQRPQQKREQQAGGQQDLVPAGRVDNPPVATAARRSTATVKPKDVAAAGAADSSKPEPIGRKQLQEAVRPGGAVVNAQAAMLQDKGCPQLAEPQPAAAAEQKQPQVQRHLPAFAIADANAAGRQRKQQAPAVEVHTAPAAGPRPTDALLPQGLKVIGGGKAAQRHDKQDVVESHAAAAARTAEQQNQLVGAQRVQSGADATAVPAAATCAHSPGQTAAGAGGKQFSLRVDAAVRADPTVASDSSSLLGSACDFTAAILAAAAATTAADDGQPEVTSPHRRSSRQHIEVAAAAATVPSSAKPAVASPQKHSKEQEQHPAAAASAVPASAKQETAAVVGLCSTQQQLQASVTAQAEAQQRVEAAVAKEGDQQCSEYPMAPAVASVAGQQQPASAAVVTPQGDNPKQQLQHRSVALLSIKQLPASTAVTGNQADGAHLQVRPPAAATAPDTQQRGAVAVSDSTQHMQAGLPTAGNKQPARAAAGLAQQQEQQSTAVAPETHIAVAAAAEHSGQPQQQVPATNADTSSAVVKSQPQQHACPADGPVAADKQTGLSTAGPAPHAAAAPKLAQAASSKQELASSSKLQQQRSADGIERQVSKPQQQQHQLVVNKPIDKAGSHLSSKLPASQGQMFRDSTTEHRRSEQDHVQRRQPQHQHADSRQSDHADYKQLSRPVSTSQANRFRSRSNNSERSTLDKQQLQQQHHHNHAAASADAAATNTAKQEQQQQQQPQQSDRADHRASNRESDSYKRRDDSQPRDSSRGHSRSHSREHRRFDDRRPVSDDRRGSYHDKQQQRQQQLSGNGSSDRARPYDRSRSASRDRSREQQRRPDRAASRADRSGSLSHEQQHQQQQHNPSDKHARGSESQHARQYDWPRHRDSSSEAHKRLLERCRSDSSRSRSPEGRQRHQYDWPRGDREQHRPEHHLRRAVSDSRHDSPADRQQQQQAQQQPARAASQQLGKPERELMRTSSSSKDRLDVRSESAKHTVGRSVSSDSSRDCRSQHHLAAPAAGSRQQQQQQADNKHPNGRDDRNDDSSRAESARQFDWPKPKDSSSEHLSSDRLHKKETNRSRSPAAGRVVHHHKQQQHNERAGSSRPDAARAPGQSRLAQDGASQCDKQSNEQYTRQYDSRRADSEERHRQSDRDRRFNQTGAAPGRHDNSLRSLPADKPLHTESDRGRNSCQHLHRPLPDEFKRPESRDRHVLSRSASQTVSRSDTAQENARVQVSQRLQQPVISQSRNLERPQQRQQQPQHQLQQQQDARAQATQQLHLQQPVTSQQRELKKPLLQQQPQQQQQQHEPQGKVVQGPPQRGASEWQQLKQQPQQQQPQRQEGPQEPLQLEAFIIQQQQQQQRRQEPSASMTTPAATSPQQQQQQVPALDRSSNGADEQPLVVQQQQQQQSAVAASPKPAAARTGLVIKIGANRHMPASVTPSPAAAAAAGVGALATAGTVASPAAGAAMSPAAAAAASPRPAVARSPPTVAAAAAASGAKGTAGSTAAQAATSPAAAAAAQQVAMHRSSPAAAPAAAAASRAATRWGPVPSPRTQQQLASPTSNAAKNQQQQQQHQQHWQDQQQQQVADCGQEGLAAAERLVAEAFGACNAGLQPVMVAYQQLTQAKLELAEEQSLTQRVMQRASERCWSFALQQGDGELVWDNGPDEDLYLLSDIERLFPTGYDVDGRFVQLCFDGGDSLYMSEPLQPTPTWPPLSTTDEIWQYDERLCHYQMLTLAEAQQYCAVDGQLQQQDAQEGQQEVTHHLQLLLQAMNQLRHAVHSLALHTASQQAASVTAHPWLWLNDPVLPHSSSTRPLPWHKLLQLLAKRADGQPYDAALVSLQQVVPGIKPLPTNLMLVQQQVAAAEQQVATSRDGLVDINCILQELPPFEDCTACWVLGSTAAAAATAAVSIDQLRLYIHQQTLSPFAVATHVSDSSKVVWVLDLVMLRLVDAGYGDMQQSQQQQQYEYQWQQQQWQPGLQLQSPQRRQQQQHHWQAGGMMQSPRQQLQQQERRGSGMLQSPRQQQQQQWSAGGMMQSPRQQPQSPWRQQQQEWQGRGMMQSPRQQQQQQLYNSMSLSQQRQEGSTQLLPEVQQRHQKHSSAVIPTQHQQQQQQQDLLDLPLTAAAPKDPSPEGPPAPHTPPMGEPAAAAALIPAAAEPAADLEATDQPAVAAARLSQLPPPLCYHSLESILAVTFPSEAAAAAAAMRFAWPVMAWRARRLLRRLFAGCNEEWDALPTAAAAADGGSSVPDQEAESAEPAATAAATAADNLAAACGAAGKDTSSGQALRQQQQQQEEQHAEEQQQAIEPVEPPAEGPAAAATSASEGAGATAAEPGTISGQQKARGSRQRQRPAASPSAVENYIAGLDPATAAAAREAMYGVRRARKRPSAEAVSDSRQVRSRSAPAASDSTSAATAVESEGLEGLAADAAADGPAAAAVEQEQLQALAKADVDAATKAAIAAALSSRRLRNSQQQRQQSSQQQQDSAVSKQAAVAATADSGAAATKQPQQQQVTSKRSASTASRSSMPASRPVKKPRKGKQAAGAAAAAAPPCARSMALDQVRAAASSTKKLGYSRGMYKALQARKKYTNAADAAADLPKDEHGFIQYMPHSLPVCVLNWDPRYGANPSSNPKAAAAVGSSGRNRTGRSVRVSTRKKVVFQRSGVHGWGLFAGEEIAAEEFVIEYIGELIRPVLEDLREKYYESHGQDSSYLFRIDKEWIADATKRGGLARYINHSCDPNCYTKIFEADGVRKIGIYAKKNISPGQELAYDYKFEFEEGDRKVPCACGAEKCRGFMN